MAGKYSPQEIPVTTIWCGDVCVKKESISRYTIILRCCQKIPHIFSNMNTIQSRRVTSGESRFSSGVKSVSL